MNSNKAEFNAEIVLQADSAIPKLPPSAIAPNNSHQDETIGDADVYPAKDTSFPVSSPIPKVSKKLTQEEIETVADELNS